MDDAILPLYLPVEDVHHWRAFDNHGLSTLCCANGRLYAVQMDPLWQKFPPEPWTATHDDIRLVTDLRCFDAQSGALLWSTARADGGALRDRWFATAPVVQSGRAHVLTLRRGEVRAVCLDAASGRLLWDTPIGPVSGRQEGQRYAMEFFLADCGPPAVADGVAVYPTGRGVVAALDALDGRLLWVAAYPRVDVSINRVGLQLNVPNGPWTPGPPLVCGNLVLVAPSDSRHLLGVSVKTGAVRWSADFPDGVSPMGVREGRLYVQHQGITCLDGATGSVHWQTSIDVPTTGLGAVGNAFAYVPQQEGLRRVNLETGRALPPVPWPMGLGGKGNLLLDSGTLVLCSPRRIAVMRSHDGGAPADPPAAPATPAEPAVVSLQKACDDEPADRALATYLALCREVGSLPHSEPWGTTSLWTHLAEQVRARCAEDTAWEAEWARACADAIEAARQSGDRRLLEELAHFAPLQQAQALALLRRGELFEQTQPPPDAHRICGELASQALGGATLGTPFLLTQSLLMARLAQLLEWMEREDNARRAYATLIARYAGTQQAGAARAGLERLLGSGASIYCPSPTEGASPPRMERAPTAAAAWSVPGLAVMPERGGAARTPGKVLVVQPSGLVCVDAVTGEHAWSMPLLRGGGADETAPNPSGLPSRLIGPGFPASLPAPGGAVVSLPRVMLQVGIEDDQVRWMRDAPATPFAPRRSPQRRLQLIRWALRGLPVPPVSNVGEPGFQPACAWDSLLACRLERRGAVNALDPCSGDPLLRLPSARSRQRLPSAGQMPAWTRDSMLAVTRGRLCVMGEEPALLSIVDGRSGRVLARWELPANPGARSLLPTAEGNVVLVDVASVYLFDLHRMRIARHWSVREGASELLHADDEWIVLRTLQDNALALQIEGGAALDLGGAGEGRPAWAAARDGTAWVIDAAEVLRTRHYGPDRHFVGSGFRLRAVRLTDGQPLWSADLGAASQACVCEPVRCGPLWLLTVAEEARTRVLGFEAATGRRAFDVALPGAPGPQPVPLLVEAGRVVIGLGGEVLALAPGDELPAVPSPPNAGAW